MKKIKSLQLLNIKYLDILISYAINKPKEFIYTHPEYKLNFLEFIKLKYYIHLRKNNYPIAYITKHKEFYNLDFYINKYVLVPRPETEIMVDEVVNFQFSIFNSQSISNFQLKNKILLIDVGTGSGCIPISILKQISSVPPLRGARGVLLTNIKTIAIDISRLALRVAKKNSKTHNVDIKFLHGNLLQPILKSYKLQVTSYKNIIITANLPYLTSKQFDNESSIQQEPKKALVSDKYNGLELYKQLLQQIKELTAYSLQLTAYLEIDPSQTKKIGELISQFLPNAKFNIKPDLAGKNRLVCIYCRQI